MENNPEQSLADIEMSHKKAQEARRIAYRAFRAARGRYHLELKAKRDAGANITQADFKAYEDAAIDSVDYVREAYLALNEANVKADQAEIVLNEATRKYWDARQDAKKGIY